MNNRLLWSALALVVALGGSAAAPALAQSGTQHPAEIRVGSCAGAGDVVAPLSNVATPAGDPLGVAGAMPVAQSATVVALPLADLLSASHMVVVYASPRQADVPVACGDVGGVLSADGTLAVGLNAVNGSKLDGVAYFAPTPAGDATVVTLLLMGGEGERERAERDRAADTDTAADAAAAPDGAARAGEDGVAGVAGQDGADGADGQPGRPGQPGQPGQDGADGQPGQSGQGGVSEQGGQGGAGSNGGNGGDGGDGGDGGNGGSGGRGGDGGDGGAGADATSRSN